MHTMSNFLGTAEQRELKKISTGGDGIFGVNDAKIAIIIIAGVGVLSALIFLCKRKNLRALGRDFVDNVQPSEWRFFFLTGGKPVPSPQRPRPPASRPVLQPPPPSFAFGHIISLKQIRQAASLRQPSMQSLPFQVGSPTQAAAADHGRHGHHGHHNDTKGTKRHGHRRHHQQPQGNHVLAANLARMARYKDDQPPSPAEVDSSMCLNDMTSKLTDGAPRLLGQERALANPKPKSSKKSQSYKTKVDVGGLSPHLASSAGNGNSDRILRAEHV